MKRTVVVGAGLAGLRTVQAMRRRGSDDDLVLIGDEGCLPYDRPPLSKDVLAGTRAPTSTTLTSADRLAGLAVDVRTGTPATALRVSDHTVVTADGEQGYDRLVIATGSSARRLPGTAHLAGVHVLRTAADAAALHAALAATERLVVVGGGFIGCEVAAVARAAGLRVAVVDPLPVLMRRALGDTVGARMTRRHTDRGVDLYLGHGVTRLSGDVAVEAVELDDGTVLPADTVLVGIGAVPGTAWLEGSGLELADGVVCDALLAAAPDVHAVGDVARFDHPRFGSLRSEHWTAAGEHASAVAATLTGAPTPAGSVPYMWSDQYGVKLQVAGRLEDADAVEVLVDDGERYLALAARGGEPAGVVGLGVAREFVAHRVELARPPVGAA